jgi:hypothetical protein
MSKKLPNRIPAFQVFGLQCYYVQLVGGPMNGMVSLCSGDKTYKRGHLYIRGPDDLYRYVPQSTIDAAKKLANEHREKENTNKG